MTARVLLALVVSAVALTTFAVPAAATAELAASGLAVTFTDVLEFIVENGDEIVAIAEALLEIFG